MNEQIGRYMITRIGQCAPEISDEVLVSVKIYLPADGAGGLTPELLFGARVVCAGSQLTRGWGTLSDSERWNEKKFSATTWREAEKMAEDYAFGELEKVRAAVRERERALRCA